jgi:predicted ATPase/DNA-binding CsgD family transcriptional regulator
MSGAPTRPDRGNLPSPATSFVGRRADLDAVRERLTESRLVTLTGPGGVGKTRLALEAGTAVRRAFPDGVWLVDLSAVAEPGRVADSVLATLGVLERSTSAALDALGHHLARSTALLILDNCEHVVEGCAEVASRLLAVSSGLRLLATSRTTLSVAGEHLYDVAPLALPDRGTAASLRDVTASDAVSLLADRARAIRPGFTVDEGNRVEAVALCERLDGIPLAIELAAIRLRTLSLAELVERLDERFTLLADGNRGARPRQQTLRAMVDWSHALCSPRERTLWWRLSVFVGGFDLAAAEDVCPGEGLPAVAVLDGLDRLVGKSIVVAEARGDQVRFRLLETIRQYGHEQLVASGEAAQCARRHREHYLARAQRIAAAWCSPSQRAGLAELRADHPNLRAALDHALADEDDPAVALELVTALRHHWYADGFLADGRRFADAALDSPRGRGVPGPARADVLWVAGWICLLQGDSNSARDRLSECLASTADATTRGFATMLLGTEALFAGRLTEADSSFTSAMQAFEVTGNDEGALWTAFQQAIGRAHQGDLDSAQEIGRAALLRSEQLGEQLCRSYTLWVLGFTAWRRGDAAEAVELTRRGLVLQQGFADPVGAALMIELLAWIHGGAGELDAAADLLAAAHAVWDGVGTSIGAFGPPLLEHHDRCVSSLGGQQPRAAFRDLSAALAFAVGEAPSTTAPAAEAVTLTRRELQIAEKIAQGLTNRAIAEALVISPRTVDGHVERMLAKLGFSTRAQIAVWTAARH